MVRDGLEDYQLYVNQSLTIPWVNPVTQVSIKYTNSAQTNQHPGKKAMHAVKHDGLCLYSVYQTAMLYDDRHMDSDLEAPYLCYIFFVYVVIFSMTKTCFMKLSISA